MAILDSRTEFCDNDTLTTGTGRNLEGSQIDLQGGTNPGTTIDIGAGEPLYLVITVTTTVTSGGAATISFELVSDAAAAIATDGSATAHITTEAIGKASLVAGYTRVYPLPQGYPDKPYERYLGIISNVATAALTAGAIDAYLTKDPPHQQHAYPDAVN